jgi:hypothetical protein
MRKLLMICLMLLSFPVFSQSVVVKPDGTHAVVVDHGGTKVIVGADGSHSLLIDNGPVKTLVRSDGTHGQLIDHGVHKILVNSDGTQSLWIDHGHAWIVAGADGSHATILKPENQHGNWQIPLGHTFVIKSRKSKLIIHPDGSMERVKPKR